MRLCDSLLSAHYADNFVPLIFHVDGDPLLSVVDYLDDFFWPYGSKTVVHNSANLGMPAVIALPLHRLGNL